MLDTQSFAATNWRLLTAEAGTLQMKNTRTKKSEAAASAPRPSDSIAEAHLVGSVAHVPAGQVDVLVAAGGRGQLEHGAHADAPAVVAGS